MVSCCCLVQVLKQVQPGFEISDSALTIMNSFVHEVFQRVATEAGKLTKSNKKTTITESEVHEAIRVVLPSELAKHNDEAPKAAAPAPAATAAAKSPQKKKAAPAKKASKK